MSHAFKDAKSSEENAKALRRNAASWDAEAMYLYGRHLYDGRYIFEGGRFLARFWLERAHRAGSVRGTHFLGRCTIRQDVELGMKYFKIAAAQGSDQAAFDLGKVYGGVDSFAYDAMLPTNREEAIRWFRAGLDRNCLVKHATSSNILSAEYELNKLLDERRAEQE